MEAWDIMVGVVVITHGGFGVELVRTAFEIAGVQERIEAVRFLESEGREDLMNHITEAVNRVEDGDGTLLLTDLFGASCTTIGGALLRRHRVEIVTGVNLPMILEVLFYRPKSSLETLKRLALEGGKKGILDIRDRLKG